GLPVVPAQIPDAIDAVAVTSVNAIRHAPHDLIAVLSGRRSFAVGAKTAAAAGQAGFSDVTRGPGDAEGLASLIVAREKAGSRVAYLTGRVRLKAFEAGFSGTDIRVFPIETYDTLTVEYSQDVLKELFADRPVDAVLLYSSRSTEAVAAIAGRPEWDFH